MIDLLGEGIELVEPSNERSSGQRTAPQACDDPTLDCGPASNSVVRRTKVEPRLPRSTPGM